MYLDMNRLFFFCHVHQFSATDMAVCSRGGGCRAVLGQGKWRSPGSCSADPVLFFRPHVFPFPEHSDPAVGKEKDHRGHRGLCSQESPTNPAKISLSPG